MDYLINSQKRYNQNDCLLHSQKLFRSVQKNVLQKLVHTWRLIQFACQNYAYKHSQQLEVCLASFVILNVISFKSSKD